jgi:hypothetical protein
MAEGKGKYHDICEDARIAAGVPEEGPGGVVLIVIGGEHGFGFSLRADMATNMMLPDILEDLAARIRAERRGPQQ